MALSGCPRSDPPAPAAPPPSNAANEPANDEPEEGFAFADLSGLAQAASVIRLRDRGVLRVPEDLLFRPDESMSRGEFVQWFVAASEIPAAEPEVSTFTDVPPDSANFAAIEGAVEAGLILESPTGEFQPDRGFSRAAFCQFLLQMTGHAEEAVALTEAQIEERLRWDAETKATDPLGGYGDDAAIVAELRPYVALATQLEYAPAAFRVSPTRYRPDFRPLKRVTRMEAAAVLDFIFFQP